MKSNEKDFVDVWKRRTTDKQALQSPRYYVAIFISAELPHDSNDLLTSRQGQFEGFGTDAAEMTVVSGPFLEHFKVIEDIYPDQIPDFDILFLIRSFSVNCWCQTKSTPAWGLIFNAKGILMASQQTSHGLARKALGWG